MTTQYTHSVTLAVPPPLIIGANSLACLMGDSIGGNMNTFTSASYAKDGVDYCVAHTVVKPVFLEPTQTGTLPPDPLEEMPEGYSRTAAEDAFASINTAGGIQMAVDVDPHEQFAEWGLERIPQEQDI